MFVLLYITGIFDNLYSPPSGREKINKNNLTKLFNVLCSVVDWFSNSRLNPTNPTQNTYVLVVFNSPTSGSKQQTLNFLTKS